MILHRAKAITIGLCLSFLMCMPMTIRGENYDKYYPFCEDDDFLEYSSNFWLDAEYLYWKIKDSPAPVPLVGTAPTIAHGAPLLGQSGAKVLLGGKEIDSKWRSGGKFSVGYWLDDNHCYAFEANCFFLPGRTQTQTVASSGEPDSIYLAVPYFDTVTHLESSSPVATPGLYAGEATCKLFNKMQGAELNGEARVFSDCSWKFAVLAGFRYWNFNEKFTFCVNSPDLAIPKEIYYVEDRFCTKNNFYGGQLGVKADYIFDCFSLNVVGKLALGAMCKEARISGAFDCNYFSHLTITQTFLGGYFALPSNISHRKHTSFALIPQMDVNLGYQISDSLSIQAGYTFLYVNKMLWASNQLNRHINPTQSSLYEFTATPVLVGTPQPKSSFREDDLWVQGINIGFTFQF